MVDIATSEHFADWSIDEEILAGEQTFAADENMNLCDLDSDLCQNFGLPNSSIADANDQDGGHSDGYLSDQELLDIEIADETTEMCYEDPHENDVLDETACDLIESRHEVQLDMIVEDETEHSINDVMDDTAYDLIESRHEVQLDMFVEDGTEHSINIVDINIKDEDDKSNSFIISDGKIHDALLQDEIFSIDVETDENVIYSSNIITDKFSANHSEILFDSPECIDELLPQNDVCVATNFDGSNDEILSKSSENVSQTCTSESKKYILDDVVILGRASVNNDHTYFFNRRGNTAHDHTYHTLNSNGNSQSNSRHERLDIFSKHRNGSYTCEICSMGYREFNTFKSHMMLHSTDKPLECVVCNRSFKTKSHLRYHVYDHMNLEFSCDKCFSTFKNPQLLKKHLSNKCLTPKHKCLVCNKEFCTKEYLKRHQIFHTGKSKYTCRVCQRLCTSKSKLRFHMLVHSDIRPHMCSKCGRGFKKRVSLENHEDSGVCIPGGGSKKINHVCEFCGHCTGVLSCLKRHLWKHHALEMPHKCTECQKTFPTTNELRLHQAVHNDDKSFVCSVCGKSYHLEQMLKTHMKFHAYTKPFPCPKCEKGFTRSNDLERHLLTHSDERVQCEICGEHFKHSSIDKHKKRHTHPQLYKKKEVKEKEVKQKEVKEKEVKKKEVKEKEVKEKKKTHKCSQCDKAFVKATHLKAHYLSHMEGKQSYSCDVCDACFPCQSSLKHHQLSHSDVKPFECQLCGKFYTDCALLRKHIGRSHTASTTKMKSDTKFTCEYCDQVFNKETHLNAHRLSHTEGRQVHVCKTCNACFLFKYRLERHERGHVVTEQNKCDTCPEAFLTVNDLALHRLIHVKWE